MENGWIILLILFLLVAIGIAAFEIVNYKTHFYWNKVRDKKWKELKPHIETINYCYNRIVECEGKPLSVRDRYFSKKTYRDFKASRSKVYEFTTYCKNRKLQFPNNYRMLLLTIEETEIAFQNPKDALIKRLEITKKYYDEIYAQVNKTGEKLLETRNQSVKIIEGVESFINTIAKHPKDFDTAIKEITVHKDSFKSALEYGKEQEQELKKTAAEIGAGVSAGAAVASMAPTAAMWVATTFGTASTGVAISTLNGAAATNAALAWLGGGALAAGGGGMAAGQALLALAGPIGWGIAGTATAISVFLMIRKKLKMEEDKREEIAQIKRAAESLKELKEKILTLDKQTNEYTLKLNKSLKHCSNLKEKDYSTLSDKQKEELGTIVNNTKALAVLISETIE